MEPQSTKTWFKNLVLGHSTASSTSTTASSSKLDTVHVLSPAQQQKQRRQQELAKFERQKRQKEAAQAVHRLQLTKERLIQFYQTWNPTKLSDVPKLAKAFQGREKVLWITLKHKYVDRAQLQNGSLQRERDDIIYTFILTCRRRNVPEVIARRVHAFCRNLHFWDYCGLRRPEDYFNETTFRNRDRSFAEMVQYQNKENALKKSLIDLGIHRHKGKVIDMGDSASVNETAQRMFHHLNLYLNGGRDQNTYGSDAITKHRKSSSKWASLQRTSIQSFRLFVKACTKSPLMIDEAFMQVMKQLKGNSDARLVYRGWQVLIMICAIMLPSLCFRRFVLHFLQTSFQDALKGCNDKAIAFAAATAAIATTAKQNAAAAHAAYQACKASSALDALSNTLNQ
jgi:hypothetical protein